MYTLLFVTLFTMITLEIYESNKRYVYEILDLDFEEEFIHRI